LSRKYVQVLAAFASAMPYTLDYKVLVEIRIPNFLINSEAKGIEQ